MDEHERETEHVEKLTRKPGTQQVILADGTVNADDLDKTELYNFNPADCDDVNILSNQPSDNGGGDFTVCKVVKQVAEPDCESDQNSVDHATSITGSNECEANSVNGIDQKAETAGYGSGVDCKENNQGEFKQEVACEEAVGNECAVDVSVVHSSSNQPAQNADSEDASHSIESKYVKSAVESTANSDVPFEEFDRVDTSVTSEPAVEKQENTSVVAQSETVGVTTDESSNVGAAIHESPEEIQHLKDGLSTSSAVDMAVSKCDDMRETGLHDVKGDTSVGCTEEKFNSQLSADSKHDDEEKALKDLYSSVKEPEEHDHQERCGYVSQEDASGTKHDVDTGVRNDNWLFLLGNDKLKKRILKQGEEGKRPDFGQLVTLRCHGRLEDGTEIDRYDSLQIALGDGDFIQAFEVCVSHMNRGEICELVSDARYAYGELGREPDVPKNATVTYEIELLSFEDEPPFSQLPISERLSRSNAKRERGNLLYSRNECNRAIDAYTKALRIVDDPSASHTGDAKELQMLVDARVKCYNNLAAAQLKIEAWDAALDSIDHVLRVQPENVKALYRKGKCLTNKGNHDAAIVVLRKAAKLEPDTKIIQQELARLEKWSEAQKKSQKNMYEKMLGQNKKPTAERKEESARSWKWLGVAITIVAVCASFAMYRR